MTFFNILNDGTDRESWLEARQSLITATDVATINRGGAGAWATLRAKKAGERRHFDNAFMAHGREREPVIAEFAQSRFGVVPTTALLGHPTEMHHAASPDAISLDGATLGEFKTTVNDWATEADVPGRYYDQMQWQMYVTGADECRFVFESHEGFVPTHMEPRVFTIARDDDHIAHLLEVVAEYEAEESGDVPEDAIELDELLKERMRAKAIVERAQSELDEIENQIRDLLGDKPRKFEGSVANLTWTFPMASTRFDSKTFKSEQPDLFKKYAKTGDAPAPRLTITERDKK